MREEQRRLRPDLNAAITGQVLNEMVYTRQVVKEVLRFRPPAPMVPQVRRILHAALPWVRLHVARCIMLFLWYILHLFVWYCSLDCCVWHVIWCFVSGVSAFGMLFGLATYADEVCKL